jgi:hypothetical protein
MILIQKAYRTFKPHNFRCGTDYTLNKMFRTESTESEKLERSIYLQQFAGLDVDSAILKMTDDFASSTLQQRSNQPNTLGCIEHTLQRNDSYAKVNLRSQSFGNQYLHHIALIAAGRRDELKAVIATNLLLPSNDPNRLQVSHLCHNSHCINQQHLVVETAKDNLARSSCKGMSILQFFIVGDEYVLMGCPHRKSPVSKHCILPLKIVDIHPGYNAL